LVEVQDASERTPAEIVARMIRVIIVAVIGLQSSIGNEPGAAYLPERTPMSTIGGVAEAGWVDLQEAMLRAAARARMAYFICECGDVSC